MSRLIKIHGMVDPHCHLRDLQWSHKATFATETAAAVAGGYWAVFDMPNTPPETISRANLDIKMDALQRSAVCDWGIYAGASQVDNTAAYAAMVSDTCGLKIFNNSTTGNLLISDQSMRDKHYAAWSASRLIALHISTAQEIAYLRAAKADGLPITIGVCPHHLFMTEADESTLRGYALMKPPLKTQADVDALWQAIRDGLVDVIESDHAPHTHAEKQAEKAAYGVPGLETTLPLLLTAAADGRIALEQVVDMVATNPRRIWGLRLPQDTYTVVDLDAIYNIENDKLFTQCAWSPFAGQRVTGKVIETWIRGTQVYDGEQILVEPGFGKSLFGAAL
jgi:dihydroorotase-like cyclic amidohydrolase